MTAPSFLLLALVLSVVGCVVVYLRQCPPRSVESGIDRFRREMEALAERDDPEPELGSSARPQHRARKC